MESINFLPILANPNGGTKNLTCFPITTRPQDNCSIGNNLNKNEK